MSTKYNIEPAVPSANLDVLATTATTSKHNAEAKRTAFILDYSDANLETMSEFTPRVYI